MADPKGLWATTRSNCFDEGPASVYARAIAHAGRAVLRPVR